jgi:hypothetical protein
LFFDEGAGEIDDLKQSLADLETSSTDFFNAEGI